MGGLYHGQLTALHIKGVCNITRAIYKGKLIHCDVIAMKIHELDANRFIFNQDGIR